MESNYEAPAGLRSILPEHRVERIDEPRERVAMPPGWDDFELCLRFLHHAAACGDGAFQSACLDCATCQSGDFFVRPAKDDVADAFAFGRFAILQKVKDGQCEFPFSQIGAECLACLGFVAGEIEHIVENLVGCAEAHSKCAECADDGGRGFVQECSEFRRDGEKRAGFHLDDAIVVRHRKFQVGTSLRLDDFTAANFAGSLGNAARHLGAAESARELEGMGKEAVAEQHAESVAPFGVCSWLTASRVGSVEDVIMDERRSVDEFDDDREIEVFGANRASRATSPRFLSSATSATWAGLDRRIKHACLCTDALLNGIKLGVDQLEGLFECGGFIYSGSSGSRFFELCETFHKRTIRAVTIRSQWPA